MRISRPKTQATKPFIPAETRAQIMGIIVAIQNVKKYMKALGAVFLGAALLGMKLMKRIFPIQKPIITAIRRMTMRKENLLYQIMRRKIAMYEAPKRRKLSKNERQTIYNKCDGHCAYCGKEIIISEMQVDHVIPMEFYESYKAIGKDIDTIGNMLPACRSCNNYKSTLTLEKFRACIEKWPEVLYRRNTTYRNAIRFGMVIPNSHPIQFYFENLKLNLMESVSQNE